jgi:hypothetical protein
VKRVKLILGTVAVMAVMMLAAVSPAVASHGWEWTDWWQWGSSDWWCSSGWFHDENDDWSLKAMVCFNTDTGEWWTWPS